MDLVLKGMENVVRRVFALFSLRRVHGFLLKSFSGTMRKWEMEDWRRRCLVMKAGWRIRQYYDFQMEETVMRGFADNLERISMAIGRSFNDIALEDASAMA
ncbi:hypothetical protein Acr_00g0060270 [Actinidia rufa]|uniref:Uncharacterized protein n=1 Tax=Actinidia rufa TaxID=165716 RepID=A0A7J0DNK0_9ERIC|nr:hypothetical protein Acr_00g0060270 [Actinidia rufa]